MRDLGLTVADTLLDGDDHEHTAVVLRRQAEPGLSQFTAALHHSRAVCRRAERHSWHLTDTNDETRRYLNRLSDLLFLLARAHEPTTEPMWRARTERSR